MKRFYNLHCHSMFSLLDAISSPKENLLRAKELGMDGIALTDHGTLAGACEFQIAADELKIKPIFGIESYFVDDINKKSIDEFESKNLSKDEKKLEQKKRASSRHILLLAKNQEGLENLYKITYISNTKGYYYRPKIDWEVLKECKKGLIVSTACSNGVLNRLIWENQSEKFVQTFERLYDLFKDDLYLEVQVHDFADQIIANKALMKLAEVRKDLNLKFIVTNDCHYAKPEMNVAHAAIKKLNQEDYKQNCHKLFIVNYDNIKEFWRLHNHDQYMNEEFLENAIENTAKIADSCNAKIDLEKSKMPKFILPEKYSNSIEYLEFMIKKGWKKRENLIIKERKIEYIERLKVELDIILPKRYVDYFLIVSDIIQWAKKQDILVGPGRGSVGGSLLAWLLEITEVDPIRFGTSFERFLNPERLKYPDIDTDYPDNKRALVRQYIADKWGKDKIASIITYSRYTANTLFRDVIKQYGFSFAETNEIAKTIQTSGAQYKSLVNIEDNIKKNAKLADFFNKLGNKKDEIIFILNTLQGKIKNTGIAAAGTIISDEPIYKIAPVKKSKENDVVVEWEGDTLQNAKYLKLDMLGLKTLTIIKDTIDAVGLTNDFMYSLSLDDDKVFEYFRNGKNDTIFQLESDGMKDLLFKIQPKTIDDINNIVALYRPLPLSTGGTEKFCKIKAGILKIESVHPFIDEILTPTLGIPLYQEQVIRIFNKLGLSKGEADLLRRYSEQMNKEMVEFYVNKILSDNKTTLTKEELLEIIQKISDYAGYLFNYSHSIQYSIISYWCQYLKVYYPIDYFFACIKHNADSPSKIKKYINALQQEVEGYKIEFCHVNDIHNFFVLNKNEKKILIGLTQVKSLGLNISNKINKDKKYINFAEFYYNNKINKKILISLNRLGFFKNVPIIEDIIFNIRQLDILIEQMIKCKKESEIKRLFEISNIQLIAADGIDYNSTQLDSFFIANLEFSINENLREKYKTIIDKYLLCSDDNFGKNSNMLLLQVINSQIRKTKRGSSYLNVMANDYSGNQINFKVWNKQMNLFNNLNSGKIIIASMKKDQFGYTFDGKLVKGN